MAKGKLSGVSEQKIQSHNDEDIEKQERPHAQDIRILRNKRNDRK